MYDGVIIFQKSNIIVGSGFCALFEPNRLAGDLYQSN
jgi:hypothetical protein